MPKTTVNKDLIEASKMFLTPLSVLVTALGVAPTEGLKTGISLIGVGICASWLLAVGARENFKSYKDWLAMVGLAGTFTVAAIWSACVHWHWPPI